jgi:cellulose synthase/poly-beta-1,6-N-acetylglucosamine synthase-like glycosyltransferase
LARARVRPAAATDFQPSPIFSQVPRPSGPERGEWGGGLQAAFLKLTVSVVIAGHNVADAMKKCLRSLAEQTRKVDEIIPVDDGSTDGMREELAKLR